jgi:hypothetical protein
MTGFFWCGLYLLKISRLDVRELEACFPQGQGSPEQVGPLPQA